MSEAEVCECYACMEWQKIGEMTLPPRMALCPTCGNKRCPKATHHDNECSGSNDSGQPGSRYQR